MNYSIGFILWPTDELQAIKLYLHFLLKVIKEQKISFKEDSVNDPIAITKSYIEDRLSDIEMSTAVSAWWRYLENEEAIRDFHSRDALLARLAICLLAKKNPAELGEHLSWFIEILGFMGADQDQAFEMMKSHFDFSS